MRAGRDYIRAWERENNTGQQFTRFYAGYAVKENDGSYRNKGTLTQEPFLGTWENHGPFN